VHVCPLFLHTSGFLFVYVTQVLLKVTGSFSKSRTVLFSTVSLMLLHLCVVLLAVEFFVYDQYGNYDVGALTGRTPV